MLLLLLWLPPRMILGEQLIVVQYIGDAIDLVDPRGPIMILILVLPQQSRRKQRFLVVGRHWFPVRTFTTPFIRRTPVGGGGGGLFLLYLFLLYLFLLYLFLLYLFLLYLYLLLLFLLLELLLPLLAASALIVSASGMPIGGRWDGAHAVIPLADGPPV